MIERIAEAVKKALLPELERLGGRLDRVEGQPSQLSQRMGDLNDHIVRLDGRIDQTNARIDQTNARIDGVVLDLNKIHDALVRREDYDELRQRVHELEKKVAGLVR